MGIIMFIIIINLCVLNGQNKQILLSSIDVNFLLS